MLRAKPFAARVIAILATVAIGASLLAALVYLAFGVVFYLRLADVRGSCDPHSANRPDRIVFNDNWPPIDLARYAVPRYETVRFPSRQPGSAQRLVGFFRQNLGGP
jgi:hypothetical protein